MGEDGQNVQTSSYKVNKSRDVMNSMLTMKYNIAYFKVPKIVDLERAHHKKKNFHAYVR